MLRHKLEREERFVITFLCRHERGIKTHGTCHQSDSCMCKGRYSPIVLKACRTSRFTSTLILFLKYHSKHAVDSNCSQIQLTTTAPFPQQAAEQTSRITPLRSDRRPLPACDRTGQPAQSPRLLLPTSRFDEKVWAILGTPNLGAILVRPRP